MRSPRRTRARLKVWAYLALFGTDDDTADETDVQSARTEPTDEREDVSSPEE